MFSRLFPDGKIRVIGVQVEAIHLEARGRIIGKKPRHLADPRMGNLGRCQVPEPKAQCVLSSLLWAWLLFGERFFSSLFQRP
jgi:hypothetical protein